jgi:hypothetical protein
MPSMKRRNAPILAALLVAGVTTSATSGEVAAQPVYKVDSVSASVAKGTSRLVIQARGAVRTGGWENARLKVKELSTPQDTMVVVFVALPPPPRSMVVQAVLPVRASVTVPMPNPRIKSVRVAAETNSVTAKIAR